MIRFSLYQNYVRTIPEQRQAADWSEFVLQMASLAEPRAANDKTKKYGTPAISPALFAPGATRGETGVIGWGAFVALDIDNASDFLLPVRPTTAERLLGGMGLSYLLYASPKSTEAQPRYRVVIPLSREVAKDEIPTVWRSAVQRLGDLYPDPVCKDTSRLYGGPTTWVAAEDGNTDPFNIFECRIDGASLDVDELIASYVPPSEDEMAAGAPPPVKATVQVARYVPPKNVRMKNLPFNHTIHNSPVVAAEYVQDYLNLGKGQHHTGLYRFATQVFGAAKGLGYNITVQDVCDYCRQLDAISPIKTAKDRWSRLDYEIARAYNFVYNH